ncbi:MAG TPA: GNAT family protein [Pseudoneobacillus sp.]|nr:GNAT family protein [Pseudoneobacillus sp.]
MAYDLGKAYWRKGYMSEILESLIQFSFEKVGFHSVEALTNLDAIPSMNLPMKVGFKEDGILRGYAAHEDHYVDQRCFSLLKHEWN